MKTSIFTLIAIAAFTTTLCAQQQTAAITPVVEADPVVEAEPIIVSSDTIESAQEADTAIIRIGKKEIKVIEQDNDNDNENDNKNYTHSWCIDTHKHDRPGMFNGHWEAFELGFNAFDKADYTMYAGNEFMSLNQGKSMEVNINFYELNIGLVKSYVGLVSGLGLSFNSYRFENPYTIVKGPQRTEPVALDFEDLSKTKLAVSTLRVPLLMEFQIPVNQHEGRLYLNAGVVGGVKIGSHTKVKHGDTKDKDRSGFNLNSFNYAATARVGYKDLGLFATYNLSPLFKTGKGPELTPFTIGISFN